MSIIETLPWTNIDVVGDVHGEIGALTSLLDRLGYDGNGNHPEDRKLVFVGDLIDRGPDSLSVFFLVKNFCDQGNAKCVLGNHELNLIIPNPKNKDPHDQTPKMKNGNHWFHGKTEAMIDGIEQIQFQRLASKKDRRIMQNFFKTLPLALENKHLRIVHACWDEHSIRLLQAETDSAFEVYQKYNQTYLEKRSSYKDEIQAEFHKQNENPIKVITSGLEKYLDHGESPYMAGKKLRYLKRLPWWKSYTDPKKVLFGHYWRRGPIDQPIAKEANVPILFTEPFNSWLGPQKNCMCLDYSVGRRFLERHLSLKEGQTGSFLGALRIKEEENSLMYKLIFDDGNEIVMPY